MLASYALFLRDDDFQFGVRRAEVRRLLDLIDAERVALHRTDTRLHSILHVKLSLSRTEFPRKYNSLRSCSPSALRARSTGSQDKFHRLGQKYNLIASFSFLFSSSEKIWIVFVLNYGLYAI